MYFPNGPETKAHGKEPEGTREDLLVSLSPQPWNRSEVDASQEVLSSRVQGKEGEGARARTAGTTGSGSVTVAGPEYSSLPYGSVSYYE